MVPEEGAGLRKGAAGVVGHVREQLREATPSGGAFLAEGGTPTSAPQLVRCDDNAGRLGEM